MCRSNGESVRHLFDGCPFAKAFFTALLTEIMHQTFTDYIALLTSDGADSTIKETILIEQFVIWSERCNRIFKGMQKNNMMLLEEVRSQKQ